MQLFKFHFMMEPRAEITK